MDVDQDMLECSEVGIPVVDSSKNAWINLGSSVALGRNCEEDVETKIVDP